MDDPITNTGLDNIGTFARRVGLTPSALRFYDDCGVLTPTATDPGTGYRYYGPDQEHRAVLLRTLREAEVPLAEVNAVLDGPGERAEEILRAHGDRLRTRAEHAHAALDRARRLLDGIRPGRPGEATIGGAELASAARQVVPAAARTSDRVELTHVLIELVETTVRLVSTDRLRMAIRELTASAAHGTPTRLLVPAEALLEVSTWAVRHPELRLIAEAGQARLVAGPDVEHDVRTLPVLDADYPDYRSLLAALDPPRHRVLTDRVALGDALARHDSGSVVIEAHGDTLRVGDTDLGAVCSTPLRIAFDPALLEPIVEAGVGPEVLLETSGPARPLLVRSADQGSYTTLVMPIALDEPAARACRT